MQEIMKIFDIHTIPNRGIVIGGTNPTLDTLSEGYQLKPRHFCVT
jgi:hypothetical protein